MKIHGDQPLDGQGRIPGSKQIKKAEKKIEVSSPESINQTVSKADKVQISSRGKEIADLMALTNNLPETRDDKVDVIKNAIKSGTYSVDPQKLAARILKEV